MSDYMKKRMQHILDNRPIAEKKKYSIPKVSVKRAVKIEQEKQTFDEDKKFYKEVWDASPHECQCGCKKKLGKEPLTTFFHHLLPKSKYPEFRHRFENIMILHPDCHSQAETDLDKVPGVRARTNDAKRLLLR